MILSSNASIIYREWKIQVPKTALLLVHGLGAHSLRWEFLANFFLQKNISSYAIELRGFGQTSQLKGHIDSFNIYFNDIRTLRNIIKKENTRKKIFLLGESMGAIIAFLLAISDPGLFDGLICISPAFQSRLKFTALDYIKIFLTLIYSPRKQLNMPFDSKMCTQDIAYQREMDSSELEHRLATPKLLANIALAQARAIILKNRLQTPTLFLLAGVDKLVDSETAKRIFKSLSLNDKEIRRYPDMYHALSIEIGKEKVFEDILKWIENRL